MEKVKKVDGHLEVDIKDINIGERFRADMGDIESLSLSMHAAGLIYPIIVSLGELGKYDLVEGERRLIAAKNMGWKKISCMVLESMDLLQRKEVELLMCVQRKSLSFIEEACAVRDIVARRKTEAAAGGSGRFSTSIRNKDVAVELNMSESRMSTNLRIAESLETHPELATECTTRTSYLKRLRNGQFYVTSGGYFQSAYEDNFHIDSPMDCITAIPNKIIDLAILHPDQVDRALLDAVNERLSISGQVLIFCESRDVAPWEELLKLRGFHIGVKPFLWHIKGDEDYVNFVWAAQNRTQPMRPITPMLSYARPTPRYSLKAKPVGLITTLVRGCVDRGSFVVIPECFDIDSVRACVDTGMNVRAATADRSLRDRLVLSVTQPEGNK